ncbi:MAG: nitrite reductase small subunit NirD [Microthrixaceae bacterium]
MSDRAIDTATPAGPEGTIRGHRWEAVCATSEVTLDRGVTALIDGTDVAIFLLGNGDLFAIDDRDPFSGASVLSRGLVGDVSGEPTVASPVYKQRFSLRTGRCLDDDSVAVRTWAARIRAGRIEVAVL